MFSMATLCGRSLRLSAFAVDWLLRHPPSGRGPGRGGICFLRGHGGTQRKAKRSRADRVPGDAEAARTLLLVSLTSASPQRGVRDGRAVGVLGRPPSEARKPQLGAPVGLGQRRLAQLRARDGDLDAIRCAAPQPSRLPRRNSLTDQWRDR